MVMFYSGTLGGVYVTPDPVEVLCHAPATPNPSAMT